MPWKAVRTLGLFSLYCAVVGPLCLVSLAQGACYYKGMQYSNNTVWESDVCTTCSCLADMVVCQHKQCQNPNCNFEGGERLRIAPNKCCPDCATSVGSCEYNGEIVGHNTAWNSSPCTQCYCNNEVVTCINETCPILTCQAGEYQQQIDGKCCPSCIRGGRSCIYHGTTYRDGEEWSPVKCTKCLCKDGTSQCYVADCPSLFCGQHEVVAVRSGDCCPHCVGRSCEVHGNIYPNDHQWQQDQCTFCRCYSGLVECTQERCLENLLCEQNERPITRDGQCCPQCASVQAPCDYVGTMRFHGDVWNVSSCEFCICETGRVQCTTAECDRLICREGETLIHKEGRCCPECSQPAGYCIQNRISYMEGEIWEPDPCTSCTCDSGEIDCYRVSCPPCPTGTVPYTIGGQCCQDCVAVQCPPECQACDGQGCVSCRQGRLLEQSRCVEFCNQGFFQYSDTQCQACHFSCQACVGSTEHHCSSCSAGQLLKWGRCVQECGLGFFQLNGECQECHESCLECTGARRSDCISCANSTNVMLRGRCVPECGPRYYLRENICYQCDASCETCHHDNPRCMTCRARNYLQDGRCIERCSAGFFQAGQQCEACHESCMYCSGLSITQCTSCQPPALLQDGRCLSNCSYGYVDQNNVCRSCHHSCRTCKGPTEKECTSCREASHLVQGKPPFGKSIHGTCVRTCLDGYFANSFGVCMACNPTCLECSDTSIDACTSCRTPLVLRQGYCVRQCGDGQYEINSLCLDCHPSCSMCSGPREDECTSCLGGYYPQRGSCPSRCPNAEFPNELGDCQSCDSQCGSCFANKAGRGSLCTQCVDGTVYPLGDTCVEECGNGYYLDTTFTYACRECHPSCRTCTSSSVFDCTTCYSGHVLTHNGMCADMCYGGYYDHGGVCQACQHGCLKCANPVECLVCRSPNDVLQFGECIPTCVDQYYLDPATRMCRECDWSCNSCSGPTPNDCLQCMDGLRLRDGACVSNCDQGYFEFNGMCKECSGECATCSSLSACRSCDPPRLLLGDECVMNCGTGFVNDYSTHICRECPANCIECVSPDLCTNCAPDTFLLRGHCANQCGRNHFADAINHVCEINVYPPSIYVNGSITSTIGGTTVINTSFLTAFDPDTAPDNLVFYILSPPTNGEIIKIVRGRDIVMQAGDSFTYEQLEDDSIRFVHNPKSELLGFMSIKVNDRQFDSQTHDIGILVVSPDPPFVTRNEPLLIEEGDNGVISSGLNLQIQDNDNPDTVTITSIEGPNHGVLLKYSERTRSNVFTLDDLRMDNIRYAHDGSETQHDAVVFQVTDGHNVINVLFYIQIIPQDNQGPIMVNNILARVREGEIVPITNNLLKAKDADSADGDLVYTLTPSSQNPKNGDVLMIVAIPNEGVPEGWEDLENGLMSKRQMRFRQRDIDEGRIYYKNFGRETTSDYFMFEISDSANPPNVLSDQAFNFEVFPSNDEPPRLTHGISQPITMSVLEGQISPITRSHLAFTDPDSRDPELVYNITQPLLRGQGTIEHLDTNRILELFTQADINAEKVVYRSPPTEVGSSAKTYQFYFTVTDSVPGGNMVGPLPFIISIVPINNAGPTFRERNLQLQVERQLSLNLRPYLSEVTDLDTPLEDLYYTIVSDARNGFIVKNGISNLFRGDEFRYNELLESSFHYVHDNSLANKDSFQVEVSDGTYTDTLTFSITAIFPDINSPTVDSSASLSLHVPEGSIATVTRAFLSFNDEDSIDSEIIIKLHSVPKQGILQKQVTGDRYVDLSIGDTFTQQDIESYNIRYIADEEVGSHPLGDLIYFNVTDANGNKLNKQVFTITITPVNDQPPLVTVVDSIEVVEGTRIPITSFDIKAHDLDTRTAQLTVVMDSPPSFGHLENIKSPQGSEFNQGIPITSFPVEDLFKDEIYYVQDIHRNIEPVQDGFVFHVTDGNNDSPQYRFNITIRLINDEEPSLITTQLFLPEGKGIVVSNVTVYVSDLDTPNEDLIFNITQYPSYGNLRRRDHLESVMHSGRILRPQDQFTYEDILEELIVFIHDGSDVEHDSFSLSVTDGVFTAVNLVNIIIGLMNDETPRVTVNRGLRVQMETTTHITQEDLLATDVDSDNKQLIYTVTSDPNVGNLVYTKNGIQFYISSDGPKSTFTQTDINNEYVKYVHGQQEPAGTVVFKFTLSDPEGNQLIDQSFLITVIEDRVPPRIVANNGLTLDEGSAKIITTDLLSATDVDSQPGNLQYFVRNPPEQGRLEHSNFPGVPRLQFTQSDIAARAISYVHTSELENSMDRFTFSVNDGTNQVTQTFYITITPVDDSLPLVTNLGMRVQEGIRKTITEFELKAIDKDTPEDQVIFTLIQEPRHGTIDFTSDERRFAPTVTFTMGDIYENRISYNHDGTNTLEDSFAFTVSDGTNPVFLIEQNTDFISTSSAQDFSIIVLPVDDGTPRIVTNLGLDYLEYVDDRAMGTITERRLHTVDQDTPDNLLVYIVTSPPNHGILESTLQPGTPLSEFTQEDISNGHIRYILIQGAEMEERDRFVFDVADSKPNIVSGNVFRISWPLVHFDSIHSNVSETAGYVSVIVKRSGNLNQNVFVMCHTRAATATFSGLQAGQHDFVQHDGQVQFEEREDTKTCTVIINNDGLFEGPIGEDFLLELSMPTFALLGDPSLTVITILDPEDEPSIEFETNIFHVNESSGFIFAPVIRKGDASGTVSVVCFTIPGTARGSSRTGLESGSDFITRAMSMEHTVVFPPGVLKASCDIKVIDDAVFEQQEEFEIALAMPSMMTTVGEVAKATIIIDGPNDESMIHLGKRQYVFNENAGTVEIEVIRTGSDLAHTSMVWCAPKPLIPPSAYPGIDFVPSANQLTFAPQQTVEVCRITIIDDTASPQVEGNETFAVYLSSAMGSGLAPPSEALIVINDTADDIPTMQFAYTNVKVEEKAGLVHIPIIRSGDLSFESSVRCYTRQRSGQVMMDFDERRNTDDFRIVFLPGDKVKNCTVGIVEDNTYEVDEIFHVKLGDPQGNEFCEGRLGKNISATITIVDKEDAPTLQFERQAYSVREPSGPIEPSVVTITVLRTGDQNRTSKVRVSTRDGSAKSGVDYEPYSKMLKFLPDVQTMEIQVEILYNKDMEWHETFSVVLGPDEPFNALLGEAVIATVTIIDEEASGSVVLPAPPIVVSLMDYDDVPSALGTDPSPGYPLVCVTPCDAHYPKYGLTRAMCADSGINMTNIKYNWEVAMPTDNEGSRAPFERIVDSTPYTSSDHFVLDSIYFSRRFHVRCVAQPHDKSGRPGVPLRSNIVTIGTDNGICHTPVTAGTMRGFQAQSFIANLAYLDPTDEFHPNSIHISVEIPHEDGMLPVISTMPIHNIRLLLAEPIYRHQHICSNMITNSTLGGLADYSFLDPMVYKDIIIGPGFDYPYQFDPSVRDDRSLDLYKHLNLKSCTWTFDAYYDMTELIDLCGGQVTADFEVRNAGQSYLTVTVPLYVSYIYVTAPTGWAALDHRTEIEFSFFYSTILWRTGLETDSVLSGRLQVLRIRIGDKGSLIIDFKTTTKFRGLFVANHHTLPDYQSRIVPPSVLGVDFVLELLWSENTFDSPQQLWRATSTYNLKDYSGDYIIELLPCTVTPTQSFNVQPNTPVVCTAHPPEKFVVPVAFQQTNRPVPVVYSLNTEFHLMNNEKVFMMNPNEATMALQEMDYKGAFSKGQKIFGRVLWNPDQDLDEAYKLQIEKLYICTGTDGFIPYYDPTGTVYDEGPQLGCMQQSRNLKNRFLLLDRLDPTATNQAFNSVPFGAQFAGNSPDYNVISNMPGVDGFTMNVDPLYKVNSGHQWFMQVIYTIGPADAPPRYRRSAMGKVPFGAHSIQSHGEGHNGTNMKSLVLNKTQLEQHDATSAIVSAIVSILFAIIILAVLIIVIRKRRRRQRDGMATEKHNNLSNRDSASQKNKDSEIEMDLHKTVKVSAVNINKPDNLGRQDVKVKKVNLDVKVQNTTTGEGGTEV